MLQTRLAAAFPARSQSRRECYNADSSRKKQARMRIVVSSRGVIAALVVFLGTTADGATTFFAVPNATGTFAAGINNAGQVVGTYVLDGQGHGFLRDSDGSLTYIDFPDAVSTAANGINDSGQI